MSQLTEIDLVIFDCDGVLIDSELISADVLISQLRSAGVDISLDYVRENFFGRSFPTVANTIRADFKKELPQDFELSYRQALLQRFETELTATKGIERVLGNLTCRKCVATSSSPERVKRSLAITQLDRHFQDDVFTASQVANGKPEPDLFLFAASSMGFSPSRTLVIEDSAPGLEAGYKAGMVVGYYSGGAHLQGVDPKESSCDLSIRTWSDFPEHLLQT